MGGLAILLIIAAYIGVASVLVYKIKPRKWKVVAIAVAILLPTADAIIGRLYLKYLCTTQAGLRVYRVVEGVEGFLDVRWPAEEWIRQYGYRYSEGRLRPNGFVDRLSIAEGGIKQELNVKPQSLYRFRFVRPADTDVIRENRAVVELIATDEVLADYKAFFFLGGWAERFLAGFTDAGPGTQARCEVWQPEILEKDTVVAALKPRK